MQYLPVKFTKLKVECNQQITTEISKVNTKVHEDCSRKPFLLCMSMISQYLADISRKNSISLLKFERK
uniref:Putative ovule protein n=1 Tax=Solanum chacoense TaxID=4108 RepID=A0A0V0GUC6_SOLCH